MIGEWDMEWVDGKGTENERHVIGEWIFSEILNGDGIQDVFICTSRKERVSNPQPDAEYGTTIRIYNPNNKNGIFAILVSVKWSIWKLKKSEIKLYLQI